MSLVENVARCRHDVDGARARAQLPARPRVHAGAERDEGRHQRCATSPCCSASSTTVRIGCIGAVERGEIPIAVAIEIASSDDAPSSRASRRRTRPNSCAERPLLAARRLVEERRAIGKTMRTSGRKERPKVTAEEVVRTYRRRFGGRSRLAKKARATEMRLVFVASALKKPPRRRELREPPACREARQHARVLGGQPSGGRR